MPVAFVAAASNFQSGSASSIATSSPLNLAAGDVLVVLVGYENASTTCTVSDGGSNTITVGAEEQSGSVNNFTRIGTLLSATANAAATITATLGGSRAYRVIIVLQFRPDSGDVASIDQQAALDNFTLNISSSAVTTTGTDEVVVGAVKSYSTGTFSSHQIGGVAADGTPVSVGSLASMWYRILSATASNIAATVSHANGESTCHILAVKFTPAAPTWRPRVTLISSKLVGHAL